MRASIHKFLVPIVGLLAAVMFSSCCCRRHHHEGEYLAYDTPPDGYYSSIDAHQIESRPIESHPPIVTPPVPPPEAPPIRPPIRPPEPPPPIKPPIRPPDPVKPPEVVRPPIVLPPQRGAKIIRIKAGSPGNMKDKAGNEWLADAGFTEGAMLDHGKITVTGTNNPELYTSEHSNMEKFTWPLPNGKYRVRLHFAENIDDIKKAGDRVFSIDANGQKINNFDIFKEAGGLSKAIVKELHVTVGNGKLEIMFKAEQKETLVNAIEIAPE